jgi:hypothetical protein
LPADQAQGSHATSNASLCRRDTAVTDPIPLELLGRLWSVGSGVDYSDRAAATLDVLAAVDIPGA